MRNRARCRGWPISALAFSTQHSALLTPPSAFGPPRRWLHPVRGFGRGGGGAAAAIPRGGGTCAPAAPPAAVASFRRGKKRFSAPRPPSVRRPLIADRQSLTADRGERVTLRSLLFKEQPDGPRVARPGLRERISAPHHYTGSYHLIQSQTPKSPGAGRGLTRAFSPPRRRPAAASPTARAPPTDQRPFLLSLPSPSDIMLSEVRLCR